MRGVDSEARVCFNGGMDNRQLPTPPRNATCPHCGQGPMSLTNLSIHTRFECPVIRPKEAAK